MPTVTQIAALIALLLFGLLGASIFVIAARAMNMGTLQAADMLGAFVVVALGLVVVVPLVFFVLFSWMWDTTVVNGPAAHYAQTQMAVAGGAAPATALPPATQTPAPTAGSVAVVLPAATQVAPSPAGLVAFPQVEVGLVIGDTLTIYENGVARQVSGPFYACGWYQGWLVACPPDGRILFDANAVNWQGAGIPAAPPTATPLPTFTPTPNPTVVAASCENLWTAWIRSEEAHGVLGAELVPMGYKAQLVGPGIVGLTPGEQPWKLTVLDMPNQPEVMLFDPVAKTIPGADWNATIEFVGTGNQCVTVNP